MQNLQFDDGFKEFSLNGDENKVIRFNPSDFSILERIKQSYDDIDNSMKVKEDIELNLDGSPIDQLTQSVEVIKGINDSIKKAIDNIFDSKVSDMVFGNQSPMSMVGGIPFYERFMNCVMPFIEKEVKRQQELSMKRVGKYTKQVKK